MNLDNAVEPRSLFQTRAHRWGSAFAVSAAAMTMGASR